MPRPNFDLNIMAAAEFYVFLVCAAPGKAGLGPSNVSPEAPYFSC